jgi:hypothetical protein
LWCHSGVTGSVTIADMYYGVPVVFIWCYTGVTMVLRWCHSLVTVLSQWCHSGERVVTEVLPGPSPYQTCTRSANLRLPAHSVVSVWSQCCYSVVTVYVYVYVCVCMCLCVFCAHMCCRGHTICGIRCPCGGGGRG